MNCKFCDTYFEGHWNKKYCNRTCKTRQFRKLHPERKENLQTKKLRRNRYRDNQKSKGLCKHCNNPLFAGGRCEYHTKKAAETDRIYKAKRDYGPLWEKQILLLTMRDLIEGIQYESQDRSAVLIGE